MHSCTLLCLWKLHFQVLHMTGQPVQLLLIRHQLGFELSRLFHLQEQKPAATTLVIENQDFPTCDNKSQNILKETSYKNHDQILCGVKVCGIVRPHVAVAPAVPVSGHHILPCPSDEHSGSSAAPSAVPALLWMAWLNLKEGNIRFSVFHASGNKKKKKANVQPNIRYRTVLRRVRSLNWDKRLWDNHNRPSWPARRSRICSWASNSWFFSSCTCPFSSLLSLSKSE